jgi:hypothetical protein
MHSSSNHLKSLSIHCFLPDIVLSVHYSTTQHYYDLQQFNSKNIVNNLTKYSQTKIFQIILHYSIHMIWMGRGPQGTQVHNALLPPCLNLVICKNFSYVSTTTIRHVVSQDTHLFSINCTPMESLLKTKNSQT